MNDASEPHLFHLIRKEDVSGISGTGKVAEGVQFSDGTCVLCWRACPPNSVGIYHSIDDLIKIHGHNGRTYIAWV